MDLFSNPIEDEEKLSDYKQYSLILTPFENSTCSVDGYLCNVDFNEEDLIIFMKCKGNIVAIDCNYGHKRLKSYYAQKVVKKSNRGRKKKEKVKKPRKYQGDGSSFNSQITFTVLGTHIRKKPFIPDKHSAKATELPGGYETVTKEYKIKVFRNGSITVPGILAEDMSDVDQPLNELCEYLSDLLTEKISVVNKFSVMRNYKCRLTSGTINLQNLQSFWESKLGALLNTKFSDIVNFLTNPTFLDVEISPMSDGWNSALNSGFLCDEVSLNFDEMKQYLKECESVKNLYVNFDKLKQKINTYSFIEPYRTLQALYNSVQENYSSLGNSIYKKILEFLIKSSTEDLYVFLGSSKDNLLSYVKYDPEKYPGFLIKIKTPNPTDPNKKTTVKIFPSGKINIDGANSRKEAEFIYYWLNHLFYINPELTGKRKFNFNDPDSEFSSDSEDSDFGGGL